MADKNNDNVRSRDDRHLHRLVAEKRAWMKAHGIEEQPPDWQAITRQERALWWRDRLRQALADLVTRGREFPGEVVAFLHRLATSTEVQAEAALEVTLDAARQVGRIVLEPALSRAGDVNFAHAGSMVRSQDTGEDKDNSVGILVTSAIPGARVSADARFRTVTVDFMGLSTTVLVVLLPEDPEVAPQVVQTAAADEKGQVNFENVPSGRYLLFIYPWEGVTP